MSQRLTLAALSILLVLALLLAGLPTTRVSANVAKTPSAKATKAAKCDDTAATTNAARLAQVLNVPSQDIMQWHCQQRRGFGEIKMAYLVAKTAKNPLTVEQIFALRAQHKGWGQIFKLAGVKPQDFYRSLSKVDKAIKEQSEKEKNKKGNKAGKDNKNKGGKGQSNKDGKDNQDKTDALATATPTSIP